MFLKCVWYLVYPFLETPWMLFFYHDARFKLCFYGNYIFCSSGFCCRTSKQKDSNWIMQIAVDYFNIFVKFQFAIHWGIWILPMCRLSIMKLSKCKIFSLYEIKNRWHWSVLTFISQKMKFFMKNLFSKCDQIGWKLLIWPHLLKKYLMENFIFCTMLQLVFFKPV